MFFSIIFTKRLLTAMVLCLAVQSFSQSKTYQQLIIVGGGTEQSAAYQAKKQFESVTALSDQFEDPLIIVKSDTVEGLNPGFFIAVLGYCKDVFKADLIIKTCNKHLKGVYKRRVSSANKRMIHFMPATSPIEGESLNLNLASYPDIRYGMTSSSSFSPDSYGQKVIVNTAQPVFAGSIHTLEINYYRGWLAEDHSLVYISEIQFTRLSNEYDEEEINCEVGASDIGMPGFESGTQTKCTYPDKITIEEENYYGSSNRIEYLTYSFQDVRNYHIGNGDIDIELLSSYQEEEGYDCSGLSIAPNAIKYDCEGESLGIMMKRGKAIYYQNYGH